jgi:hypothetical protein
MNATKKAWNPILCKLPEGCGFCLSALRVVGRGPAAQGRIAILRPYGTAKAVP